MNEMTLCPICYSDRTTFLFEGWDLIFAYPEPALVYQCRRCDHVFVAGELTPEQLTEMYTNYYPRGDFNVDDYEPYKEKSGFLYWLDGEEARAYRHIPKSVNPKDVRVLDIGCGYCETLGYHNARGCDVYGVEADENARKIAEKYGFNIEIGFFDPKKYEPESFDYVTMDYVFEHVVDPLEMLQGIRSVLKPGGKIVMAMPNVFSLNRYWFGRYWIGWHLPFHRHFYSYRSMKTLAENAGYDIVTMRTASPSVALLSNWGFFFSAGAKGKKAAPQISQGCGKKFDTETKKRFDVRLFLFLKKIRFLSFTMRLTDMIGLGDNHLTILEKG